MSSKMVDYETVTEIAGDAVSQEQVERMCRRYYWAGTYCTGKNVLEVACGSGQGLGYLAGLARSVRAGDYSETLIEIARNYYRDRIEILQFDAQDMPFEDASFDVVLLFEALYYIPDAEKFVRESWRVLRPGGTVLVATANKDLYDFNPSPYTYKYYGTAELYELFGKYNFEAKMYGDTPLESVSMRQRLSRPLKSIAARFHLIPGSNQGKKLLKRLIFGRLTPMPAEISAGMINYVPPVPIDPSQPDKKHKVILCAAQKI